MNKTMKCFRFQMSFMKRPSIIFTCIYIVSFFLITCVMMPFSDKSGTANMSIGNAAVIFLFICMSACYSNLYNTLLIFGNTRKNILSSLYMTAASYSAVFAVLSLLSDYLSVLMSQLVGFRYNDYMTTLYVGTNDFEKVLWTFGLLFLFTSLGLLYGSLTYKFGRNFIIVFWCAFGLLFTFIPILTNDSIRNFMVNTFKWYFGIGYNNGILIAAMNYVLTGAVLCAINYLIARRQPQNV